MVFIWTDANEFIFYTKITQTIQIKVRNVPKIKKGSGED
jgi:hypothetical protein